MLLTASLRTMSSWPGPHVSEHLWARVSPIAGAPFPGSRGGFMQTLFQAGRSSFGALRELLPLGWQAHLAARRRLWAARVKNAVRWPGPLDFAGRLRTIPVTPSGLGVMQGHGEQPNPTQPAAPHVPKQGAPLPRSEPESSSTESLSPPQEDVEETLLRLMSDLRLENSSKPRLPPQPAPKTPDPLASATSDPKVPAQTLPSSASHSRPNQNPAQEPIAFRVPEAPSSRPGREACDPPARRADALLQFRNLRARPSSLDEDFGRPMAKLHSLTVAGDIARSSFRMADKRPDRPPQDPSPARKQQPTQLPGQHLEEAFERLLSESVIDPKPPRPDSLVDPPPARPDSLDASTSSARASPPEQQPEFVPAQTLDRGLNSQRPAEFVRRRPSRSSRDPLERNNSVRAVAEEQKPEPITKSPSSESAELAMLDEAPSTANSIPAVDRQVHGSSEDPFVSELIRQLNEIQLQVSVRRARIDASPVASER
jgi:hypothetical protein